MLESVGLAFDVVPSEVAEVGYGGAPSAIPQRIVVQKVKSVKARLGTEFDGWILGADTLVALGQDVLGKPNDRKHATTMLARLSGVDHQVYTAFRIENALGEVFEQTVMTEVSFAKLTASQIESYVSTGEADDKAGAYAIQGRAAWMVKSIRGSYTNVVGLPLHETLMGLGQVGALTLG